MKSFEARKPFRILAGILAIIIWPTTFGIAKLEAKSFLEMIGIATAGSIFALALTFVAFTGKIPAWLRSVFSQRPGMKTRAGKNSFNLFARMWQTTIGELLCTQFLMKCRNLEPGLSVDRKDHAPTEARRKVGIRR
jgi:MFS-type transporter involved in bile tolerance (Atg22 family)